MIRTTHCRRWNTEEPKTPHHLYLGPQRESVTPPNLLHVTREAREATLEHYSLTFAEYLYEPVYFDFSRDILCFEDMNALSFFTCIEREVIEPKPTIQKPRSGPAECSGVRKLALLGRSYQLGQPVGVRTQLHGFYNLKTLFPSNAHRGWEIAIENILQDEWKEGREQKQQDCKFIWKSRKKMRSLFL
jgi:hypothetical protein